MEISGMMNRPRNATTDEDCHDDKSFELSRF